MNRVCPLCKKVSRDVEECPYCKYSFKTLNQQSNKNVILKRPKKVQDKYPFEANQKRYVNKNQEAIYAVKITNSILQVVMIISLLSIVLLSIIFSIALKSGLYLLIIFSAIIPLIYILVTNSMKKQIEAFELESNFKISFTVKMLYTMFVNPFGILLLTLED